MLEPFAERMYQIIGNNIYRFRVLEHLSQERLAEKAELSTSYISQIECCRLHKGITCTTIIKIAESLQVPPCVLMAENSCQKYVQCLTQAASLMEQKF
ncbi:MAG: helix-turn-helix transcriptional regulator [Selenomonadaceae bacterium]|nr:helix-turn-helix transcriptional regulator [Selenomonadaceae bacterium]